jgi:hypothetical protein
MKKVRGRKKGQETTNKGTDIILSPRIPPTCPFAPVRVEREREPSPSREPSWKV